MSQWNTTGSRHNRLLYSIKTRVIFYISFFLLSNQDMFLEPYFALLNLF